MSCPCCPCHLIVFVVVIVAVVVASLSSSSLSLSSLLPLFLIIVLVIFILIPHHRYVIPHLPRSSGEPPVNCLIGWLVSRLTGQPIVGRPNGWAAGWLVGLPFGQAISWPVHVVRVTGGRFTSHENLQSNCIDSINSIIHMFIFTYPLNCQHRISLWTPNCNTHNYYSIYLPCQFCRKIIYYNKNVQRSHVQSIIL